MTQRLNPIDVHVGRRAKMRRNMLGMSQETLAGALGITFQQVQKYEKGVNRISASRLQHIANVLKVAPEFFFEGVPGVREVDGTSSYVAEFFATPEGLALCKAFMELPSDKLRRRVVALVVEVAGDS
jgi:transcriptional regulator with XRE-family HTH domain